MSFIMNLIGEEDEKEKKKMRVEFNFMWGVV